MANIFYLQLIPGLDQKTFHRGENGRHVKLGEVPGVSENLLLRVVCADPQLAGRKVGPPEQVGRLGPVVLGDQFPLLVWHLHGAPRVLEPPAILTIPSGAELAGLLQCAVVELDP